MKKITFLAVLLVCTQLLFAQGTSQVFLGVTQSNLTLGCQGEDRSILVQTRYQRNIGFNQWVDCATSSCYVQIQQRVGGIWYGLADSRSKDDFDISNPIKYLTFTPAPGVSYRVLSTMTATGGSPCFVGSSISKDVNLANYTVTNTPTTSTFKIAGQTSNSSTYANVCEGSSFFVTNIGYTGTSTDFMYRFGASRNGGAAVFGDWNTGTPPSTFFLELALYVWFPSSPIAANYDVFLETKNVCAAYGTHTYTGKLRVHNNLTSITYKVNGTSINNSTYTEFCQGNDNFEITNMTGVGSTGTGSGAKYFFSANKVGGSYVYTNTINGFPSTVAIKTLMKLLYSFAPLAGQYTISIDAKNDCGGPWVYYAGKINITDMSCKNGDEEDEVVREVVGVNQTPIADESDVWSFYPNPARDNIVVSWTESTTEKIDLRIFDLSGRQIKVPLSIGNTTATLDVSMLSSGSYVLYFNQSPTQKTKLLLVE